MGLRLTHNMLAWCLWLLLAALLLLQPTQQPLSTDGAPGISNRIGANPVARPQQASLLTRADQLSGGGKTGPDSFTSAIAHWLAGWHTHTLDPTPFAISPLRDFLSRRTAHPRAPPA